MATILNSIDEDDETRQGSTGGAGATNVGGGPTAVSSAPSAAPAAAAVSGTDVTAAPKPSSSGSFTNLSKYVNANKDFKSNTGGLAGSIVGNINNQAQNVQKNVTGAQNQFNQQANTAASGYQDKSLVTNAIADPYAFSQNQANKDAFAKIRDAQYTGPNSLQDLSGAKSLANLQLQANNVQNTAKAGQTENGRFNLLKSMFGNKDYSRGQQTLDNVLLQQNQDQLKKLQGASTLGQQAVKSVMSGEQAAQNQAKSLTQQADEARTGTRDALNNSVTGTEADIQNALSAAQNKSAADLAALQSNLTSGRLTQQDVDLIKTNPNAAAILNTPYLYGQNSALASALSQGVGPTAQQIANKAQYDRLSGLGSLMGDVTPNETTSALLSKYSDPTQAGTYKEALGGATNINNILAQGKQNILNNVQGAISYIDPYASTANRQDLQKSLQNIYSGINNGQDVSGNINQLIAYLQDPDTARKDVQPFIEPTLAQLTNLNNLIGSKVNYGG